MIKTDRIDDAALGALLQHLHCRLIVDNAIWDALIELQRTLEQDIDKGEGDAKTNGKRRHNLYVLQDSLLVLKAEIEAIRSSLDRVDAALDQRGYTGDERAQMRIGRYAW